MGNADKYFNYREQQQQASLKTTSKQNDCRKEMLTYKVEFWKLHQFLVSVLRFSFSEAPF